MMVPVLAATVSDIFGSTAKPATAFGRRVRAREKERDAHTRGRGIKIERDQILSMSFEL
jgi:hypothetical protein